jgi:nitrogenase molybdenum-iron protein beta chain
MAVPLLRARTGCALHGALFTADAIDGVMPVLHSTMGCAVQADQLGRASGCGGHGPAGGIAAPSSNISEKHIVFGGASRLREQIKNTTALMQGELTVVLSGCAAEMIGDDIAAMVRESCDQGEPVLNIATAGFRGSAHHGYEAFLKGVIASPVVLNSVPRARIPRLVNILGLVPHQDAFWLADIEELSRMIAGIGLRPNPLFGPEGGVQGLRALAQAELSLVVSPWGLGPAQELEREFGIPWLDASGLPVGADASSKLLRRLCESVDGADRPLAEAFLTAEARREDYILNVAAEELYRQGAQRDFAIVALSLHAGGLSHFLIDTLGWTPCAIIVTDNPARSPATTASSGDGIRYSEDSGEIDDILLASGAEIILGSAFERPVASQLGVPLIEVSFPTHRPGLSRGLGGFRGGLALIEEIVQRRTL